MTGAASNRASGSRRMLAAALLIGAVLVVLLTLGGRRLGEFLPQFAAWVDSLGFWGPAIFILGYAVAAVAFIPGSLLTLAAGAIFGLVRGTLYTLAGATLGSTAAFLIARYAARRAIERRIAASPKFTAIDRAVGRQGFKIVALLRLSPVFPFNALNYLLGLTRVRFLDYLLASAAMLPGTLLYVYYGKVLGLVVVVSGGAQIPKGTGYWIAFGLGLATTIVATTFVTRVAGRALRQEIGESLPQTSGDDG